MNRTVIIVLVVLAIGIISGGVFFAVSRDTDKNQSSNTPTTGDAVSNGGSSTDTQSKGSLASIRTSGKAQECSFSYSGSEGSGTGKMYTDGAGKGLLTIDLTTDRGNTGSTNTLVTGDKVYGWTKTANGSFGMVYSADSLKTSNNSSQQTGSQNAGQDFDLSCKSWSVDPSKFAVPSDVNFTSLPSAQ